jgi:hypothetical protein
MRTGRSWTRLFEKKIAEAFALGLDISSAYFRRYWIYTNHFSVTGCMKRLRRITVNR